MPTRVFSVPLFSGVTVNATGSQTSGSIPVGNAEAAGTIIFTAASAGGTADVSIQLAFSHDNVTFSAFAETVELASSNTTFSATPEGTHIVEIEIKPAKWMQVRFVGVNANPADTLLTAVLNLEEL